MPSSLPFLDLATLNEVQDVVISTLHSQYCQWEQQSADAIADDNLSFALMFKHWASAADQLAMELGVQFNSLLIQALDARCGIAAIATRSPEDQVLDAMAIAVASCQPEPS